jgi:hypothetical protein
MKYHSSKSIAEPGADRYSYQKLKSHGTHQPIDFGENKFLHSFNTNNQPSQSSAHLQLHQMREASSPGLAHGQHVVSMADPTFNPQTTYFGQTSLAERFQDKFEVNGQKSSDSRSRSHENISIKQRNSKQPLNRVDNNIAEATQVTQ